MFIAMPFCKRTSRDGQKSTHNVVKVRFQMGVGGNFGAKNKRSHIIYKPPFNEFIVGR